MLGYRKDENVTELYAKHQLLNIKHLYKYELGKLGYKNVHGKVPGEVSFYYERNTNNLLNSYPYKDPIY